MALTSGLFSNNTDTTFADARRDLEGAVVRDTAGKIRAGVFYNRSSPIVTGRADMRLDISDFRAVLDCGGAVFIGNAGTMQSPAFGAAPSANRRIDTLILVQPINPDGATGKPFFEIVQGDASPTPVAPPIPARRADALPIADVEIPASATSLQSAGVIITPRYRFTAMAGGTVVMRSRAEVLAWNASDGAKVFCLGDGFEYERRAGKWWCREKRSVQSELAGSSTALSPFVHQFLRPFVFVSQFTAVPDLSYTATTPAAGLQFEQMVTKTAAQFELRAARVQFQPVTPIVEYTAFGPIQ